MESTATRLQARLAGASGRGVHTRVAGVLRGSERSVAAVSPIGQPAPDDRTLFEIGSVTKVFTAVLLAEMHLRGEVALTDPLSAHLPADEAPTWRHREPTLEELATHRAALPNVPRPLALREQGSALGLVRGDPWRRVSETDYRRMLREIRPRSAPGRRVGYSSVGFGLLGDALARRARLPFGVLIEQRVCGPLGLTDTGVEVRADAAPRLLDGRSRRGSIRPPIRDHLPAAGALRSSARDLLSFLEACLAPPGGPLGDALALAGRPRARINRRLAIGLGWMVLERRGHPRALWHNGGTWGFRSFAAYVPGEALAVVVLSNTTTPVDRLGFTLLDQPHSGVA